MLTSSSLGCWGQALGAGQSVVGAVEVGEEHRSHSTLASAHLEPFPNSSARCPIPYTANTMSLNTHTHTRIAMAGSKTVQFAHSFLKSDTGLTGTRKLSQTMARCGKPLVKRRYIGILPVATLYMYGLHQGLLCKSGYTTAPSETECK